MEYMHVKISESNTKMGRVPSVSTTPIKACGNCSACSKDCYALKAYRMYKNTREAYDHNYKLATNYRATYMQSINEYLCKKRPIFFRWHVSGDILDQAYLESMKQIARLYRDTKFLCFTKMYALNYSNVPSNLRIVFSAWPGLPMPKKPFPIAYMQDGTETRVPTDAMECIGNCETCGMCWSLRKEQSVVFHKH